jgi:ABC-2 type transport system permease protein
MTTLAPSPRGTLDPVARAAAERPLLGWRSAEASAMIGRCLRRSLREPDTLIMAVALPVTIMLLFVTVFGGEIDTGMAYVDFVVPGIVLLCAGYGASTTAVSVASDMTGGIMGRFRSLPIRPSSVLTGHVVASLVRNAVSTALVVGVAYLLGFRPAAGAAEWLLVVALLAAYVLALTWVAVCVGVVASSPEAAAGFSFGVMFLPYVSSAFVRPETMPAALEWFARYQPVTPVTDTLRGWLVDLPGGAPLPAFAWCALFLVVARVLAGVLFARRAR